MANAAKHAAHAFLRGPFCSNEARLEARLGELGAPEENRNIAQIWVENVHISSFLSEIHFFAGSPRNRLLLGWFRSVRLIRGRFCLVRLERGNGTGFGPVFMW